MKIDAIVMSRAHPGTEIYDVEHEDVNKILRMSDYYEVRLQDRVLIVNEDYVSEAIIKKGDEEDE